MAIAVLTVFTAAMFLAGIIWQGTNVNQGPDVLLLAAAGGGDRHPPVYALVAIGGAVHSRRFGGPVLDVAIAPLLAWSWWCWRSGRSSSASPRR